MRRGIAANFFGQRTCGSVMAAWVTVGVNPQQQTMCIFGFKNTDTLFDVVGWWVEATS